jgi:hypothetical protein
MKEGYKALEDLVVRGATEEGGKEDVMISSDGKFGSPRE